MPKWTRENSYFPYSVVKAVYFLLSSAIVILQYPDLTSNIENKLEPFNFEKILSMHMRGKEQYPI